MNECKTSIVQADSIALKQAAVCLNFFTEDIMKKSIITVLLVKPYEAPQTIEIPAALSAYQELVGGTIQAIYPSAEDPVALVCHDEGKLLGLPLNRPLFDEEGNPMTSSQVPSL